jgi:hypothetical protein
MVRISIISCVICAALTLVFVSGCSPATSPPSPKGGDAVEVLTFEVDEIEIIPGVDKDVKVKSGKAESAEAPKDSGVTAKVADGKVTISAAKDAKEGTHEVKVKGGKKDAVIKVKVKKADK